MKTRLTRICTSIWQVFWAITLITLPITSFPLISKAAGGTLVAPLAMIPLAVLSLAFIPVYLLSRKPIIMESKILLLFVIVAFISSAAAYFSDIPPFKGYTLFGNNLEAFITLGIGLAFYFVTWMMASSSKEINRTLIFINVGGMILLIWSLIQIIASVITSGQIPRWMETIQSFISIKDIQTGGFAFRVSGTTLEPSWLAHSLNMLYLPIWLGFSTTRYSAFRFRIFKLSMENLLLGGGIIVLIFTYSRIGLLAFGLALVWYMIMVSQPLASRLSARLFQGKLLREKQFRILLAVVLVLLLVFVVGGLAYGLSLADPRFQAFFSVEDTRPLASGNLLIIANRLDIAERVVYWDLGWHVFQNHPIQGVGLGNTGMFSLRDVSDYAWKLPEVYRILFYESTLPNSKCLWVRILAETGIIGFAVFFTWLIILWVAARRIHKNTNPMLHALGLAGQLTLLALLLEGFSIDTFALPYYWVALGLVTAASFLGRRAAPGLDIESTYTL